MRLAGEWGRVGSGGRITLELPLTRAEIAESLGAPRESVSRALSAFSRRGLISLDGDAFSSSSRISCGAARGVTNLTHGLDERLDPVPFGIIT